MKKTRYLLFLIFIKFICITLVAYSDNEQPKSTDESQLTNIHNDLTDISNDAREYEIENMEDIENIENVKPLSKLQLIAVKVGIFLYIQYFQIKRKIGYLTRVIRGRISTTKMQPTTTT